MHNAKATKIQFLLILNSKSVVAKVWFITSWDITALRKWHLNPLHSNANFKLYFLKLIFTGVYWFTMLYYFLLYGKVNQIYVYKYSLCFGSCSHKGHYRVVEVTVLYTRSLLVSLSISQFIPPPPILLVTVGLFSTSLTLLLFCK